MKSIFFNVRPGTAPDALRALVDELRSRPEVREAGPLRPGVGTASIQRMYYATLDPAADAGSLVRELSERAEVESASEPSERHLIE